MSAPTHIISKLFVVSWLFVAALGHTASASTFSDQAAGRFFGNDLQWLMDPSLLAGSASDPAALQEISRLMVADDPRAGLALQNYIGKYPSDAAAFDLAGVSVMQRGETDAAIVSFTKAVILAPANPWLRAKLGVALSLSGDRAKAQPQLEAALQLDPDNPLALRALAQFAVQDENLPLALQYSQRALRAFGMPSGTVNQAHFDLAQLYTVLGRHRDVVDLLRPAATNTALDIPDAAMLELMGRYLDAAMAVQDAQQARTAFERLTPLVNAQDPRVQLTKARLLRMEGKTEASLALLKTLATTHPEMAAQLRPDEALTLAAAGRQSDAARLWWQLADEAAAGQDISFMRAAFKAEQANGTPDAAVARIEAVAQAHPSRADLRLFAAEMLSQVGQLDLARERALELTTDFPKDPAAFVLLGQLAAAAGQTAQSVDAFEQALSLDPAQPRVWLTLAGVVHGHGSYVGSTGHGIAGHKEVETLLERAIAANPRDADLKSELGLMHLSDGNVETAIERFDAALADNPSHIAALSLGALARADLNTDLGTALALIDRATVMAPDEAINRDIMGWVLVRQGAYEQGLDLLRTAAEQEPEDVTIQYHLGVAYQSAGQPEQAVSHLVAALSGPNYQHNITDARARLIALSPAHSLTIEMDRIDVDTAGQSAGTITATQTDKGLSFAGNLMNLPEGLVAAHVHEYANCHPGEDGAPGGMAGAHYGHGAMDHHTSSDGGMNHSEHMAMSDETPQDEPVDHSAHIGMAADKDMQMALPVGDLRPFSVSAKGTSRTEFVNTNLSLEELRGRSLMLHLGADVDGQSGPKIACGVIK